MVSKSHLMLSLTDPGNAKRLPVGPLDAPANRLPCLVVRLEDAVGWDDAKLALLPSDSKTWFFGNGFGSCVVSAAGQGGGLRPARHEAKASRNPHLRVKVG